jgi:hypothetical protein
MVVGSFRIRMRVPRKIIACKRDEVTGRLDKTAYDEFHDFHSSPNITEAIKSRIR